MSGLVISGGRVVDPASGMDAIGDVAVLDGKIAAVGTGLGGAERVIDATGLVVAPGSIDLHAHGQSIPADRMQAFDGVTTSLDLEAGVLPVASWYRHQAAQGRVLAPPVAYGILATTSGRFFSSQATASGPSTTHSKVSQVGSSRDSGCSRVAAYSTRSCKRSYPCRRSSESAIAVLAHPRWAKSTMLGASASLNQGVASNSMQRTLSAVWQVAWIIGFLRSPANNLR
jgi:imidazolonepropionase-like amidohydrolase